MELKTSEMLCHWDNISNAKVRGIVMELKKQSR